MTLIKIPAVTWPAIFIAALGLLLLAGCSPGTLTQVTVGWSPLATADGIVYVGSRFGEVKALVDNGLSGVAHKWTYKPQESKAGLQGVFSTPLVGKDLVYVSGLDGYL